MSQSASQAAQFYRDVVEQGRVWTIEDANGIPAPKTSSGQRAMPFWSTKSRAERVIADAAAYKGFTPVEVEWEAFVSRWAPGLEGDGLLIGINWSGPQARGYDMKPSEVVANVEAVGRGATAGS